jgi:hypothetical protein
VPAAEGLGKAQRVKTPEALVAAIDRLVRPDVALQPASREIRYRHVTKAGRDFYLLFNEGDTPVSTRVTPSATGRATWLDPSSGQMAEAAANEPARFQAHQMRVLMVDPR